MKCKTKCPMCQGTKWIEEDLGFGNHEEWEWACSRMRGCPKCGARGSVEVEVSVLRRVIPWLPWFLGGFLGGAALSVLGKWHPW